MIIEKDFIQGTIRYPFGFAICFERQYLFESGSDGWNPLF
jgi:hypothetical protein